MIKIKNGDKVIILSGNDKNKIGRVIKILPKKNKVLVKGINLVKKSIKLKDNKKYKLYNNNIKKNESGFLTKEMFINLSKVSKLDNNNIPVKVSFFIKKKKKIRIYKKKLKYINK
ncbi:50S ribosomal protein L24 [Candidatus Shikimatogenerans silvanidophilus]|uniref:50S ribosomal protein L24 n=1 Tax=Candidatus Shikimatogenerans silvanidophilus TaxID=2782547 RepID=UPI001BA4F8EF|nr:50S ribosomal protein L24 [Candidatus Shikimatogenerans silvanidophilus]